MSYLRFSKAVFLFCVITSFEVVFHSILDDEKVISLT